VLTSIKTIEGKYWGLHEIWFVGTLPFLLVSKDFIWEHNIVEAKLPISILQHSALCAINWWLAIKNMNKIWRETVPAWWGFRSFPCLLCNVLSDSLWSSCCLRERTKNKISLVSCFFPVVSCLLDCTWRWRGHWRVPYALIALCFCWAEQEMHRAEGASGGRAKGNHVAYLILAEFNIDKGSSITAQYPSPTQADTQCVPLLLAPNLLLITYLSRSEYLQS